MPETNHYEIVPPRQAPIVHEMAPTGGVGAASTATRELDDLMASLSEFQVMCLSQVIHLLNFKLCKVIITHVILTFTLQFLCISDIFV